MKARRIQPARFGLFLTTLALCVALVPAVSLAAPYAAMVVDARDGKVLHSRNADTRLHPASLTKMMTLYIAFEAVENGEISLDTKVKISKNAAAEPPSKLGLLSGQKIALRYLIRAAAVKSANDAATAIGEALEGSEAAFARRMNRTAKALGMSNTTFKNAHGLTESGHMSTARDMTTLGRHVLYDYPEYSDHLEQRLLAAERRNVGHYGFGTKGFVLSMIETAIEVTEERVPASVIADLMACGREMLQHPIDLLPGADDVVESLARSHRLLLITKGDLLDQERKVAQSGLGEMFDWVEIVSHKTTSTYIETFRTHADGAARALMVGDSLRSDILPALTAGSWAAHIPNGPAWALEQADIPAATPKFVALSSLSEVLPLVQELD